MTLTDRKMENTLIVFERGNHDDASGAPGVLVEGEDVRSSVSSLTSTTGDDFAAFIVEGHEKRDEDKKARPDGTFENINHTQLSTFGACNNVKNCDSEEEDGKEEGVGQNDFHVLSGVTSDRQIISYAQLFFDPETKKLVTIIELNLPSRHNFFSDDILQSSHTEQSDEIQPVCEQTRSCGERVVFRGAASYETNRLEMDGRSFHAARGGQWLVDETLITECSSISSATSTTGHDDGDESRNDPDIVFEVSPLSEGKKKDQKSRGGFCNDKAATDNETIFFSHSDFSQLWFEEKELSLYLLHDDGEPWDTVGFGRKSGCTESLRKLLAASRSCISLRQLGTPSISASRQQPQKIPMITYSSLDKNSS